MPHWIRVVAAAQVLFFAGWAAQEEWERRQVPEVLIETVPVDPRDILSGHYMRLGFRISNLDRMPGLPKVPSRRRIEIGVLLKPAEKVRVAGKEYDVWRVARVKAPPPVIRGRQDPADGLWVRARLSRGRRVTYGIERYHFSERRKDELNKLRPGQFYVLAAVGRDGKLVLRDLLY